MPERTHRAQRPHHRALGSARTVVRKPAARLGFALALTTPVLAAGVSATSTGDTAEQVLESAASSTTDGAEVLLDLSEVSDRVDRVSRSSVRTVRPVTLEPKPVDQRWTTTSLNIWTGSEKDAEKVGLIEPLTKVAVTGQRDRGRVEVLLGEKRVDRWVTAGYLAESKPQPPERTMQSNGSQSGAVPSLGGSCTNGTSLPAGVSSSVVAIHQSVCANWPQITTYGTLRADSPDHSTGRAIDIMVSGAEAWAIAEFLRANYNSFDINYVIHARRIWSVDRAGEGWRAMEDRGSPTANHEDHVHVSVY